MSDVDRILWRSWIHGLSIASTRQAVARACGLQIEFEAVRQRFVDFGEIMAGEAV